MTAPSLTRRAALSSAAGAGVASLLGVPAIRAATTALPGRRPFAIERLEIGRVRGATPMLAAPGRFQLAGVSWRGPREARIELRTPAAGWTLASARGHAPDLPKPTGAEHIGEGVWTGTAERIQLRTDRPLKAVRLHLVSVEAPPGGDARAAEAYPLAQPVLEAGPGQPPIIARSAWGHGHAPPAIEPGYGTVKLAFVHHTDNANAYTAGEVPAMLLAIYAFHRYVRGWHDIGYNFLIDLYGRIWEGRAGGIDQAVVGAQAGGYNLVSTGVAVLGTFTSVVPSPAAIDSLQHLLAWKLALHGVPTLGRVTVRVDPKDAYYTPFKPGALVSLPRVAGHRDGDSTDCPGNAFYARLPAIRPRIAALAGAPAELTLRARPGGLGGRLTQNGLPIPSAPVELHQLRGDVLLAEATTAPDGSFVFPRRRARTPVRLRALHPQPPVVVSELLTT